MNNHDNVNTNKYYTGASISTLFPVKIAGSIVKYPGLYLVIETRVGLPGCMRAFTHSDPYRRWSSGPKTT